MAKPAGTHSTPPALRAQLAGVTERHEESTMSNHRLEDFVMHRLLLIVGVGALALMSITGLGHAGRIAAQDVDSEADAPNFTGSWRVMIMMGGQPPAYQALATFGADGTFIASILGVEKAPWDPGGALVYPSAEHGAWEPTGSGTAVATFVVLLANGEGEFSGTTTGRISATLAADGQTFSVKGDATVADPQGNVIATVPLTAEATRIVPEAPAAPSSGTPVA